MTEGLTFRRLQDASVERSQGSLPDTIALCHLAFAAKEKPPARSGYRAGGSNQREVQPMNLTIET